MTDNNNSQDRDETFWYSGKVTRRRLIGWSVKAAGALTVLSLGLVIAILFRREKYGLPRRDA